MFYFHKFLQLYEREVCCASGGSLKGQVRDYTQEELKKFTSFAEIPAGVVDIHLGRLLFAHAKSRYRSLEFRQYRAANYSEVIGKVGVSDPVSKKINIENKNKYRKCFCWNGLIHNLLITNVFYK